MNSDLLLISPFLYFDKEFNSTWDNTIYSIVMKKFDYGANWIFDALDFIKEKNIKKTKISSYKKFYINLKESNPCNICKK